MKCSTCGNPVPRGAAVCPYCESPLSREAPPARALVKTFNLKEGGVTGEIAADRMETLLANARAGGVKVAILIHGYGSSGQGGATRAAVRSRLSQLAKSRRIRAMIFGEEFGPSNDDAIRLASTHQSLLAPHVFGAGNEGITIVGL